MLYLWRRRVGQFIYRVVTFPHETWKWLRWKYNLFVYTLKAVFYNEFVNAGYVLEVAMEPMVWVVDHFSRALGPILVGGVICLTSSIVSIVYIIGLPYYWNKSPAFTCALVVVGHWMFVNIVYHFAMGAITDPGTPPKGILISEAVSVCKKCIAPKPPRTHHCSVCNRCVLKMDHHCPWLNNCVGHFNHRHFYLYMVYMTLGTFFIITLGCEIAYQELWLGGEDGVGLKGAFSFMTGDDEEEEELEGYPVRVNETHIIPIYDGTMGTPLLLESPEEVADRKNRSYWYRFSVMYTSMLTLGVFISLGGLSTWHGRLVSRGETSIEAHINKKETERLAKINQLYQNPYDFGVLENWKIFLGLSHGRGLLHVLLPSSHSPDGSGLTWPNSIINTASHDKAA